MTHDETDEPAIDGSSALATKIDDGDTAALEAALSERSEPFARATIVRREPPVSANVGDQALVTADGEIHGWVGGAACAQSIVATQGVAAVEEGTPRLVGIAPDPERVDRPGLDAFPMTCHSEGVLELFIEPVTPTTELVIVGASPVARALSRLAAELTVDVTLVVADGDVDRDVPPGTDVLSTVDHEEIADAVGASPLVVVASMGEYDARGVAAGVLSDAPYAEVVDERSRASPDENEATAGDDPDEHDGDAAHAESDSDAEETDPDAVEDEETAIDPVCGMTVDPTTADASVDHDGQTYHFCCHGCADSFANDPASYLDEGAEA